MFHGPECKDVTHTFVSRADYEQPLDRRRLKLLPIDRYWLLDALAGRIGGDEPYTKLVDFGLPDDARIEHFLYDYRSDTVMAVLWSQSFPVSPEAVEFPVIRVETVRSERVPPP